jgi:hypothetical protein
MLGTWRGLTSASLSLCRRGLPAISNYIRSGMMLPPYDHAGVYLPVGGWAGGGLHACQVCGPQPLQLPRFVSNNLTHVLSSQPSLPVPLRCTVQAGYEEKKGLFACLPCVAPPAPPPPPPVPEHVAMMPEVAEPSVRLPPADGQAGAAAGGVPRLQLPAHMAYQEKPLRLVLGSCNIPHPSKVRQLGRPGSGQSPQTRVHAAGVHAADSPAASKSSSICVCVSLHGRIATPGADGSRRLWCSWRHACHCSFRRRHARAPPANSRRAGAVPPATSCSSNGPDALVCS